MREQRHRIRPAQTARVRELREDATIPECLLWSRLRAGRSPGAKWRRQAAIGNYIVDFYCPAARLVVEIDGMSHDDRARYDYERSRYLEGRGLRVLRYTNDQALADLDAIAEDIARQVAVRNGAERSDPPPTPP